MKEYLADIKINMQRQHSEHNQFVIVCVAEKESWQDMTWNLWFTFDARVNNIVSYTQSYWRVILP